ncbi:type II toxin-antitoxin system RelE/ParE family toxin [Reichenbachiella ulvae]|uniref:type II toxin-antitoxin system RelE/ParE family toxin n=1 Tax=Reichenbachiella ulvae TaxID=2980104 RepID=UPI00384E7C32
MVRRKIVWSQIALEDKIQIYSYWFNELNNHSYGKKLEKLFNKSIETLAIYPRSGRLTEHKYTRARVVKHYILYYQFSENTITILRVWDARQDPNKLKL